MNYQAIKDWALARLQEKTTWVGIVTVLSTLLGVTVAPAKAEAIETTGVVLASAVLIGTKEPKSATGTAAPALPSVQGSSPSTK